MPEINKYFELAQREQWRGEYQMALQYYQRAIEIEPNRGEIYWEMSISLAHVGMSAAAKQAKEKAAQLSPMCRKLLDGERIKPG